MTTFAVPDSQRTSPNGVNNQRQVSGTYADANFGEHGFVWSNGSFTTIDVPNSVTTNVFGINERGEVVGLYVDTSGVVHGFVAQPASR